MQFNLNRFTKKTFYFTCVLNEEVGSECETDTERTQAVGLQANKQSSDPEWVQCVCLALSSAAIKEKCVHGLARKHIGHQMGALLLKSHTHRKKTLSHRLTGGPGFPLGPVEPGNPIAPWKNETRVIWNNSRSYFASIQTKMKNKKIED